MDFEAGRRLEFIPRGKKPPFFVARAEGHYLYTPSGDRVFDAAGGAIVASLGHGHPEVIEAATAAMREVSYAVPPFGTPGRLRLVERLVEHWLPPGFERMYFACGGGECIDAAVRLARAHHVAAGRPSRTKIISRTLSYHGTTVYNLALGGNPKRSAAYASMAPVIPKAPAPYCFRCPLGKQYPSCEIDCADDLERLIEREGPDTIAAFLAEPIGGTTAPVAVPPPEYWPKVRDICDRHGILLIADEVMVGFGRTGKRFALEHFDLRPDIMAGGKGLAAGYAPLGGVFTTDAVVAPIAAEDGELMFVTYGGHPTACAVADKVLEILERDRLVEQCAERGRFLLAGLEDRLGDHPNVAAIRGKGLILALELVKSRDPYTLFDADARITQRVLGAGFSRGVSFYPAGAGGLIEGVSLGPPFTISEPECDMVADTLAASIDDAVARA